MDWMNKFLGQVRTMYAALGTSGRVAVGLCALLVVIGAAWLVQWSSKPERVPLLSQPLSAEDQARMTDHLRLTGAEYEIRDNQIRVAEADRPRLLASLQQARALPARTSMSFEKLMEDNSPFVARDDAQWRRERALEAELSAVLTHFDGLSDAKVFIQVPQRRRIGMDSGKASASVYVQSRPGGSLDKGLVASIADFVSGAVEGLSPDAVKIVDSASGRSYRVPGKDDATPFDVLDLRRQREDHYARKISEHLSYIAGVLVGVHADLNLERKQVRDTKFGKPVPGPLSEETTSSTTTRGGAGGGPGVRPNVARSVAGGGGGESTTREESRTAFDVKRDERVEQTESIPGDIRKLTASINVPRSYYVGIYKQQNPDAKEIKDANLDPIIKSESAKIRAQVKPLVAAADEAQVEVGWYYDSVAAASGSAPGAAGPVQAGGTALTWVRDYGPQAGLAGLALGCVVIVLRLARRAGMALERSAAPPAAAAAPSAEAAAPSPAPVGAPVGETMASSGILEGREVNDEELRIRHIVAQIGQLVKEDAQTASALVEHWAAEGSG